MVFHGLESFSVLPIVDTNSDLPTDEGPVTMLVSLLLAWFHSYLNLMKMMLNNAELEEELDDIWEHVIDHYDAPRLCISYGEPSTRLTGRTSGTWVWMDGEYYILLIVTDGHARKTMTDDLDEILFRVLLPAVRTIAADMNGNIDDNEIMIFSVLGERWERRMNDEINGTVTRSEKA